MEVADYEINSSNYLRPERCKPILDRVLVRLHKHFSKDMSTGEGGARIFLPGKQSKRVSTVTGEILALGSSCETVKVGQHCMFVQFVGQALEMPQGRSEEQGMWLLLAESDILSVWDHEELAPSAEYDLDAEEVELEEETEATHS